MDAVGADNHLRAGTPLSLTEAQPVSTAFSMQRSTG